MEGFGQDFWHSLPAIITALAWAWVIVRQHRVDNKIEEIHKATNGLTKALVDTTAEASHSQGMLDERKDAEKKKSNGLPKEPDPHGTV